MIYRGPGILAVVWFGFYPTPLLPSAVSKLDARHIRRLKKRDNFLMKEEWGEGGGSQIIRECLVLYKSFNTLLSFLKVDTL